MAERTKIWIADTLKRMLKQKPIEEIRVTGICREAEWEYIVEYYAERYSGKAKEKLGTDTLDAQTQYSIRLYCHGAVSMTREWLLKDNITPARTVVQMMFNSMPGPLRRIYFRDGED